MLLKSITLRGFKTFADATEIEFPPEAKILALVGPNGCGKSNLLDAVRWVLGEDNPRELRVNTLTDIIFAGSSERKPLSLAEATLVLDNASGSLPTPFTEVALKRRTFREGESEFFINKNLCRLKDIQELLLDTGLGENSYSIITQGKVDLILSSRGEDRRVFFEEAAGIAKYKSRKLTAERKLIAAEQNFLRINDLKIEVSEQLIVLEEQSRKAREYQQLQEKVKELELGLCKHRVLNLLKKKEEASARIEEARKKAEEQRAVETRQEEEISVLRNKVRKIEEEIDIALLQMDQEKDRLRDVELERRFKEGELERAKRERENLNKKKDDLLRQMAQLKRPQSDLPGLSWREFEEVIYELYAQLDKFNLLIADILGFFGGKQPASVSPAQAGQKDQALLDLLSQEVKRVEDELGRLHFSAKAFQSELVAFVVDPGQRDSLSGRLNELRTKKKGLEDEIISREEKARAKEKSEASSRSEEVSLEIALAKIDGEISGILERISLDYSLSHDDLLALPIEISNLSSSRSDLERGKVRLRELEPVNLLAIEEYDQTKERVSFLEAQLADITSARENLRILIFELDAKAKETFLETMQKLSLIFSEIFSKLFSGGEARIFLSNPQAPLESEIEISVRPFGKKWLPLTLLSGGERSLCAIAILFSFLRIRPSPFCFLDEVDAALDDANVCRFSSMLKDFSRNTQLIVITHNKQTMAVAESIYGITMEDPGVSKVISMRLAEVAV